MKINWKSVGAFFVTLAGVAASSASAFGPKVGTVIALIGAALQAVTHPVADPTSTK